MAEVLDWRNQANQQAVIVAAAKALGDGRIVLFPTECGYCAAASPMVPEAVDRLARLQATEARPLTLALASDEQALEWAPEMSRLARRLARRCWPGPVTLV